MSLAEAREEALALKGKAKSEGNLERRPVAAEESDAPTVEALLNGYVEDMRDRKRSSAGKVQEQLAYHVIPYIGNRIAREITEDDINDILARIFRAGHRTMANRIRAILQTAWKWGRMNDKSFRRKSGEKFLLQTNPVAEVPRDPGGECVDDRVMSWREIKQLWYACDDTISTQMRLALKLGIATGGQRPSEFLQIPDEEIDEKNMIWRLPAARTKKEQPHIVPLSDQAMALIEQARSVREKGPYLFPMVTHPEQPTGYNALRFSAVIFCERIGADRWTPKTLRTTFKTLGGEIGISREIRDRLQNHIKGDVASKHYDRYDYLKEKREAMAAWEVALKERL